jgi:soluble lytic murein transglycosylase-like protein
MSTTAKWRPLITQTLALYPAPGLTGDVVEAMIATESSGKPDAYRFEPGYWDRYCKGHAIFGKGNPRDIAASYGLLQVMYPTAYSLGFRGLPEGLFDPQQSLLYGVLLMRQNLTWSEGNLDAALAAYNGGRKGNRTPPYRNGIYLAKVKKHLAVIQKEPHGTQL